MRAVDHEWTAVFLRVLGDELRRARRPRRWTRAELLARLGLGLCPGDRPVAVAP